MTLMLDQDTLDFLQLVDRVLGLIGAAFMFGVFVGFIRAALGAEGERLRALSIGVCLFAALTIIECLRVRSLAMLPDGYVICGRMIGIAYDIGCIIAAYCVLRFLWLTIPETINGRPERANWAWYTSPLYPPWGIPNSWREFVDGTIEYMSRRKK